MAPRARAIAIAKELDRLLGAREDASGARVVRSVEHAPDVSRAALFGAATSEDNASTMPDAFYCCRDALVMSYDAVVVVREASATCGRGGATDFDAAATALCANGDHATAWNARKRVLKARFDGVEHAGALERDALVALARDELAFAERRAESISKGAERLGAQTLGDRHRARGGGG